MKQTLLQKELPQITTTSYEQEEYVIDASPVETGTKDDFKLYDINNYINHHHVETPENHSEFDQFLKELEQSETEKLKEARSWVADQFYAEDGDTIKTLRLRKGLSQAQLAELMGKKQSYISRVERGTENFMLSTMVELCEALSVDMNTLTNSIYRQECIYQKKHNEEV